MFANEALSMLSQLTLVKSSALRDVLSPNILIANSKDLNDDVDDDYNNMRSIMERFSDTDFGEFDHGDIAAYILREFTAYHFRNIYAIIQVLTTTPISNPWTNENGVIITHKDVRDILNAIYDIVSIDNSDIYKERITCIYALRYIFLEESSKYIRSDSRSLAEKRTLVKIGAFALRVDEQHSSRYFRHVSHQYSKKFGSDFARLFQYDLLGNFTLTHAEYFKLIDELTDTPRFLRINVFPFDKQEREISDVFRRAIVRNVNNYWLVDYLLRNKYFYVPEFCTDPFITSKSISCYFLPSTPLPDNDIVELLSLVPKLRYTRSDAAKQKKALKHLITAYVIRTKNELKFAHSFIHGQPSSVSVRTTDLRELRSRIIENIITKILPVRTYHYSMYVPEEFKKDWKVLSKDEFEEDILQLIREYHITLVKNADTFNVPNVEFHTFLSIYKDEINSLRNKFPQLKLLKEDVKSVIEEAVEIFKMEQYGHGEKNVRINMLVAYIEKMNDKIPPYKNVSDVDIQTQYKDITDALEVNEEIVLAVDFDPRNTSLQTPSSLSQLQVILQKIGDLIDEVNNAEV